MLVSTVTAITSGRGRPSAAAVLRADFRGRLHHRAAAGRVHVDHPRARRHRGLHRAGDGVRDVVKLQIEEDAIALARELADHRRSRGREELLADLEAADRSAQRVGELDGPGRRFDIQGDENRVHA